MLIQCSIVANLFDRVCIYLFQFKVLGAYAFRRQQAMFKQERMKEKRDIYAHAEKSATRITKTVSQWEFCHTNAHIYDVPIILNCLHFFIYFLNSFLRYCSHFSQIHLSRYR